MSQVQQRQDAARSERLLSNPAQQSLPSRGPHPPVSPLNSTLIPRDFLTQRSDQRNISAPIGRKLSPSPLQASHVPSPTLRARDDFSVMSSTPSTPISIAEFPQTMGRPLATPDQPMEQHEGRGTPPGNYTLESAGMGKTMLTNGNVKILDNAVKTQDAQSSPKYHGQIVQSPPDSPASTVSSVNAERAGAPPMVPRTSSIDSAISTISASPSHSRLASVDATIPPSEITKLIAAAGSPEKLIQHLLREKQHAESQNTQLWNILNKQRQMVFGLNKDLERAVKDKERYKKKFKELQDRPTPIPQTAIRDEFDALARSEQQSEHRTAENTLAVTPQKQGPAAGVRSPVDTSLMPSPLHLVPEAPAPVATGKDLQSEYLQRHPPPAGPPPPPPSSAPESSAHHVPKYANAGLVRIPPARPPPTDSLPATPTDDEGQQRLPLQKPPRQNTITKKAPPAPLNLHGTKVNTPSLPNSSPGDLSDSEYEDDTGVLPHERGRRKTRADDDRDRETAAKVAEEARSRSKKLKSPSSSSEEISDSTKTTQVSSPRQIVSQNPPDGMTGGVGSLNALLKPDPGVSSAITETLLTSPPMSPGLPISPRPLDRPMNSPLPRAPRDGNAVVASPPLSPRLGLMPSNVPLSPRAPKAPIPLPPNTPISIPSPPKSTHQAARSPASPVKADTPLSPRSPRSPPPGIPIIVGGDEQDDDFSGLKSPRLAQNNRAIFRGYVHEDYPNLLLPPNALPSIDVKVASSRLRPSRHSYMAPKPQEEDPVFTLSVFARSNRAELWRVEKVILSLPQLDQQLKSTSPFTARLPERKLFSGHSPAIVDLRRNALNNYFEEILDTPMDEKAALVMCRFLTEDAIEPRDDETSLLAPSKQQQSPPPKVSAGRGHKEGYLTKRGKNFGGWKARFFVMQGPDFRYYESPGGPHLGTIKLHNAQIGKQSQSASPSRNEDDSENQYRHAFLILEPKRKDSTSLVRHVLCAESDQERDDWVEALLQYVDYESEDEDSKLAGKRAEGKGHITGFEAKIKQYGVSRDPKAHQERPDITRGLSYENTVAGPPPQRGETPVEGLPDGPSSPTGTSQLLEQSHPSYGSATSNSGTSKGISGPVNGAVIHDAGMWGNKPTPQPASKTDREHKKRSIWGFRQRSSSDLLLQVHGNNDSDSSLAHSQERPHDVRPVFGLPLSEAVEYCAPIGINVQLPAVVYRCIEYLRAKNAASEEGIFRLSGSNVVVRGLKEKFNTDGDLDFLADDQYYDVHAVASLFKTYLRELPTTILTRDLHLDFLHVLDLESKDAKVAAFYDLVHRLPSVNFELLKILSEYLIEIISNADKNKMTVRNVGIVFSPTLNIPAPVFSTFLTDFEAVFGMEPTHAIQEQQPVSRRTRAEEQPRSISRETAQHPSDSATSFPNPHAMQKQPARPQNHEIENQPAYEQRHYVSDPQSNMDQQQRQLVAGPEYQAVPRHRIVTPNSGASAKAKRRESSMFLMGMGGNNRKSSMPQLREDQALVGDESAF